MSKRVVKCYLKNLALLAGSIAVAVGLVVAIFTHPGLMFYAVILLGGAAMLTAQDLDRRG